jgi:hypothetical protein
VNENHPQLEKEICDCHRFEIFSAPLLLRTKTFLDEGMVPVGKNKRSEYNVKLEKKHCCLVKKLEN